MDVSASIPDAAVMTTTTTNGGTMDIASMTETEFEIYMGRVAAEERRRGLANVSRVADGWCKCANTDDEENYYQRENGRHGWFHDPELGGCGGITQTG